MLRTSLRFGPGLSLLVAACVSQQPNVLLSIEDPNGITLGGSILRVGRDRDALRDIAEGPLDLPITIVLLSDSEGQETVWADVLDQDGARMALGATQVTISRSGASVASLALAQTCSSDLSCNDGTFCGATQRCSESGFCVEAAPPCESPWECVESACVDSEEGGGKCEVSVNHSLCNEGSYCNPLFGCTPGEGCESNAECQDGDVCNGSESCINYVCVVGGTNKDNDGDGFFDGACAGGADCDDETDTCGAECFPGNQAPDLCDGFDQDCDGEIDEDEVRVFYRDRDADGFTGTETVSSCEDPDGDGSEWKPSGSFLLDCDDTRASVNPGLREGPRDSLNCNDGVDNDCDGLPDQEDEDCAPSGAQAIYRSVGAESGVPLASGTDGTFTTVGDTGRFSFALPDRIGVGDVIELDTNADSTPDLILVIHGRQSSTLYKIRTPSGEYPPQLSDQQNWRIFRAYSSLSNAEAGNENGSIDSAVRDFDPWSGGKDISTRTGSDEEWHIACYTAGEDIETVEINGWVTSPDNRLRIFTPTGPDEVGASQRHRGKAEHGYLIHVRASNRFGITVAIDDVVIEGLTFELDPNLSLSSIMAGIYVQTGVNRVELTKNLIYSNNALSNFSHPLRPIYDNGSGTTVTNNIAYGIVTRLADTKSACFYHNNGSSSYFYNNTAVGCIRGFYVYGGYMEAINNLVQNSVLCAYCTNEGLFAPTSDFNLGDRSDDGLPGLNSRVSQSVVFRDPVANDYHLADEDETARGQGKNLSTDAEHPFSTDIDSDTRSGPGGAWDIGADQHTDPG